MTGYQILGAVWLLAGLAFLMRRMHKDGALVPFLKGIGMALLVTAFIGVGLQLLLDTKWN